MSCGASLAAYSPPAAPAAPPTYPPPPGAPGYPPPAYPAPAYAPTYAPPPKQAHALTILRDAFDLFMKDPLLYFAIYLVYAVITSAISLAITLLAVNNPLANVSPTNLPSNINTSQLVTYIALAIGVAVIDAIVGAIVSGMTAYYAVQRYRGTPTTPKMSFDEGVKHFLSIIGAQILIVLAGVGLLFIAFFVIIAGAILGDLALVALGGILVLVLGIVAIYLLLAWSLSTQAIMLEGKTAFASLSRSWELTRGHRLSIFGAALVVLLLVLIVSAIVGAIFGLAGPYGTAVGSILATAITGSWILVMTSVAYHLILTEPRYGPYPMPPPVAPMPPAPPR